MTDATETYQYHNDTDTDNFRWGLHFTNPNGLIRLNIDSLDVKTLVLHTHAKPNHVEVLCTSSYTKHAAEENRSLPFCHDVRRDFSTQKLYPSGGNRLRLDFTSNFPNYGDTVTLQVPEGFDLEVNARSVLRVENHLTHKYRLSVRKAKWTTFAGYSGSSDRDGVSWEYTEFGSKYDGHPTTVIYAPLARIHLRVPEHLQPLVQRGLGATESAMIRHAMDAVR